MIPAGILVFLCVFSIPCTVCQEEQHMLKHSCLWLRTAYILRYNVTAINSKHQKSVKLENQCNCNEYKAHLENTTHCISINLNIKHKHFT